MQNVLYHAWEMGQESWSQVAQMLIVAEKVTIWGLSYGQLNDANLNHGLPYTPDQFLELVRQGFITIGARPSWYAGAEQRDAYRGKNYIETEWHPKFDGELARMAGQGKVRLIEAPQIQDFVDLQIESRTQLYHNALYHIRKKTFPANWHMVAKRKIGSSEPTELQLIENAIATSRHHLLAAEELQCDASVEALENATFFVDLDAYTLTRGLRRSPLNSITLEEVMYSLSRMNFHELTTPRAFDRHLKMLHELRASDVRSALSDATGQAIIIDDDLTKLVDDARQAAAETVGYASQAAKASIFGVLGAAIFKAGLESREELSRRQFMKGTLSVVAAVAGTAQEASLASDIYSGFTGETPVQPDPLARALLVGLRGPFDGRTPTLNDLDELSKRLNQISAVVTERYRGAIYRP